MANFFSAPVQIATAAAAAAEKEGSVAWDWIISSFPHFGTEQCGQVGGTFR